jgi:hypothetical protein
MKPLEKANSPATKGFLLITLDFANRNEPK